MECPVCHKDNPADSHFCIFCGSTLSAAPATDQTASQATGRGGDFQQELFALWEEVRRLRAALADVDIRLEALQGGPSVGGNALPQAAATPADAAAVPPAGEAAPSKGHGWDWEQALGGNWLALVGVLALIIGAAFFLKLAFDNNWIGPTGRVILGILGGLALLGAGEYWRRRYPPLARSLSGGGIAILYLSIYAAFALYGLISLYPATGFLLLISIAAASLALRYESMSLAIIGILGAFGAPFILEGFVSSPQSAAASGHSLRLLVYVMVVDLGVLALASFRNWRWFTLLALLLSLASFGGWFGQYGDTASLLTSQVILTLMFLIFVGSTTLFHIIWRRPPEAFDQSLMVLNAAAYFGISYGLLWDHFRLWMGGFALALALFYGGLAYLALKRGAQNARLSLFALGIALVFLTIAIPVQLGDRAWTTIAWAAEGVALVWLSLTLRLPTSRLFAYGVFVLATGRLLIFDTPVELEAFRPVLNERFLAFLVAIAALYLAAYLLWRGRESLQQWEREGWSIYPIFLGAANLLTLWLLSAEIISYFDHLLIGERFTAAGHGLQNARNLSLTALWALYASVVLAIGIAKRSRPLRIAALVLLAAPIAKVFVYDVFTLDRVYRIGAFIGLGVVLVASGYLYQRYSKAIRGFLVEK